MANNQTGEIYEEIKLHVQQTWSGATINEMDVVSSKGNNDVGRLTCFNWSIHEDDGVGAAVIGHVKGLCSKVSSRDNLYYRNFCIVIDPVYNEYKELIQPRSTICASGVWEYGSPLGSVAAVAGGTGKYEFAREW